MRQTETTQEVTAAGRGVGPSTPALTERTRAVPPGRLPAADDLVLDRYRLEDELGRGGHGTVWRALDERLERDVAVKVIARARGQEAPRVEREGRVAARLNHPGIVALYELGSDEDAVYLVSELVRGRTMAELTAAGALSDQDVAEIGVALCAALEHAHAEGVVHRDVKPHNVIVVAEPAAGAGFAKLTDFGVAHVADEASLTRTGDVVGTLAYMAPEQAEGARVSAAADVYSLALTLREGWTGAGNDGVVAARLAGRRVIPLRRLRRDLPRPLCDVVDAALDPRPELRPPLAVLDRELRSASAALPGVGGLVEPATQRRFGIPSARAARARGLTGRALPHALRSVQRVGAGLLAGALVLIALETAGATPLSLPAPALVALTVAAVALLPRIGWLAAAICALGWLLAPEVDLRGSALLAAAVLFPIPILLVRAGLLWSVPALAALLGAIGLAALFPALAALASTAWRRAALAALGFAWLAVAELLTGEALLFGAVADAARPRALEDSLTAATLDGALPTALSPMPATALCWLALALGLPVLVRGHTLALDLLGAGGWAVACIAVHGWLGERVGASAAGDPAGDAVLAALLGAGAAVGVERLRAQRSSLAQDPFPRMTT